MVVATWVTMRVVVATPLTVTSSLASEPKPLSLLVTLTSMLLWSGTSVMGLARLSMWWKGSDDSSNISYAVGRAEQASIDSPTSVMHDLFSYFRINPDA
jgi:hypothetical protein